MNSRNLPFDSREETKSTAFIKVDDDKFRLVYTKAKGQNIIHDVLKIEINNPLEYVISEIMDLLKLQVYRRIHLFLKYKFFTELADRIEEIYEVLKTSKYNVNFVFVSKKYKEEDYILLYDIYL
ncbi:uncharacterized protein VNE69_09189 [Vairimorpha necatrix]|uniref:Uncharacterized protein n=1 Tax=Vairimorpha necatrix TaxID=6039 RepID=A0AAX4JFI0_9MICR